MTQFCAKLYSRGRSDATRSTSGYSNMRRARMAQKSRGRAPRPAAPGRPSRHAAQGVREGARCSRDLTRPARAARAPRSRVQGTRARARDGSTISLSWTEARAARRTRKKRMMQKRRGRRRSRTSGTFAATARAATTAPTGTAPRRPNGQARSADAHGESSVGSDLGLGDGNPLAPTATKRGSCIDLETANAVAITLVKQRSSASYWCRWRTPSRRARRACFQLRVISLRLGGRSSICRRRPRRGRRSNCPGTRPPRPSPGCRG